jgi:hypothetical protein
MMFGTQRLQTVLSQDLLFKAIVAGAVVFLAALAMIDDLTFLFR